MSIEYINERRQRSARNLPQRSCWSTTISDLDAVMATPSKDGEAPTVNAPPVSFHLSFINGGEPLHQQHVVPTFRHFLQKEFTGKGERPTKVLCTGNVEDVCAHCVVL